MNAYKITAFAMLFATCIAANAFAQGAMSAPQNSMAAPSAKSKPDGMAKDSMAMGKPMTQKKKAMKKDSMKPDAMKSDSMMAPAH
jgi:pentapeptide MXKDX repeat protein